MVETGSTVERPDALALPVMNKFVDVAIADTEKIDVDDGDILLLLEGCGESVEIIVTILDSEALLLEVEDAVRVANMPEAVIVIDRIEVIELDVVDVVLGVEVAEIIIDAEINADTLLIDEEVPVDDIVTLAVSVPAIVGLGLALRLIIDDAVIDKRGEQEVLNDKRDDAVVDALTVSNNFCVGVAKPVAKGVKVNTGVSVRNAVIKVVAVGSDDVTDENDGSFVAITDIDGRTVTPLETLLTLVPEMPILDDGLLEMIDVDDFVLNSERVFDTVGNIVLEILPLLDIDGEAVELIDFFDEAVEDGHCDTDFETLGENDADGVKVLIDDTELQLDEVNSTLDDTETRAEDDGFIIVKVNKGDGDAEFVSVANTEIAVE